MRAPEVAWVRRERLAKPVCGAKGAVFAAVSGFRGRTALAIRPVEQLQGKMWDYAKNGARLGWLVDPEERKVRGYELDKEVRILENPDEAGDPILPGFVLDRSSPDLSTRLLMPRKIGTSL